MLQAEPRPTSRVLSLSRFSDFVELKTARETLRIEPLTEDVVRISFVTGTDWGVPALERVLPGECRPQWRLEEGTDIVVATGRLHVRVSRDTGRIGFFRPDGTKLLEEAPREARILEPFDSLRTVFEESRVEKVKTPDGWKDVILEPKRVFRKQLYRARLAWTWEDEALYGLGQHETGVLNLRGTRQYVHHANLKIAMPLLVSSRGYGLLFDTGAPLIFNDTEAGSYVFLEAVEQPAYYFLAGGTLDGVIAGYRQLTGRASLPPRWCFGYLQSQERYETQQELLEVVREYRRRKLPLDAVILDWMSWKEGHWGQKSFDPDRFPDPSALTAALHELGARLMVSIWPNMDAKTDDHQELKAQGHLFPGSDLYNAFSPAARKAYWEQARRGLFQHGLDGWWCDSSEPVTPEWNLVEKPEPDRNYREFLETARTWMDEELTCTYALWHARAMEEGQRSQTRAQRVVNLTRSGWAGQQRYGTILWSGDTSASWETLRNQIAAGLGLAASGMPYWTVDIGAFFVKRGKYWFWDGLYEEGNRDPAYRELYLRWFQFAAFLPVLRAHGTDTRREVWCFGEPGEAVYDALARFLRLRYSLLPYLYSLAAGATFQGGTLLRLLAFDFPDDPRARNCKDQFLLGKALLVCPVICPSDPARPSRPVYLPAGTEWWDFWTHEKLSGGTQLEAPAPLEAIPLYVRAGSILPLAEPTESTRDLRDDQILLQIFPGADGEFLLYQDDGETLAWEEGAWSTVLLRWEDRTRTLFLEPREGSWAGMPPVIEFQVRLEGRTGQTAVTYAGGKQRVVLG